MEIWKEIDGYENYKITKCGKISCLRYNKEIIKKTIINKFGYEWTTLTRNKEHRTFLIHKLVALNFIPLVDGKDFVNHKDGDKLNNNAYNLEWCTRSENMNHAYETGLKKRAFSNSDIAEIRELGNDLSISYKELSNRFKISKTNIEYIIKGKIYKKGYVSHKQRTVGSISRGETHTNSKLKDVDVIAIRNACKNKTKSQKELAEEYGMSQSTIYEIVKRKIWKHI